MYAYLTARLTTIQEATERFRTLYAQLQQQQRDVEQSLYRLYGATEEIQAALLRISPPIEPCAAIGQELMH